MTPKTLRKELRDVIFDLLELAYQDNPPTDEASAYNREQAEKIADAVRELRGVALAEKKLPAGSSLAWQLASGATSAEIAAQNEAGERERELLNWYESKMGYGTTLEWWGKDADLVALRKFLVTQTREDIETFCKWCDRPYSKFGPENAKWYPRDVMTFWPRAFIVAENSAQAPAKDGKGFYA